MTIPGHARFAMNSRDYIDDSIELFYADPLDDDRILLYFNFNNDNWNRMDFDIKQITDLRDFLNECINKHTQIESQTNAKEKENM